MAGVFGSIGKNLLKGLLTGAAGYAGNKIIKRFTGGRIRRGRRRRRTRRYSGRAKLLRRLIMRRMRRRGRFRRRRRGRRGGFLLPPLRHGGMIGRGLTDDDASSSKKAAPRRKLHKLIEGYGAQAYEVPIADNIDHNINYPRSSLTYPANRKEEKNLLLGTAIAEMTGKGETSSVSFTPNTIGSQQYNSKKRSTANEASSSALDEDIKNVAKSYSLRDMREIDKPFKNVQTPLTMQKLNAALPHVINNKDNKKLSFPEKNDLVVNFVRGSLAHNKKLMSQTDNSNSDPQPEIEEPMIEDDSPSFTFSSAFDGSGRNSTMPLEMTGGAVTRGQTGRKRVHFNMDGSIKRPGVSTASSSSSAAALSSPWRTHPMIIIRGKRLGLSQTGALRPKGPLKDYHVSSVINTKRARRGRPHKYMRRGKSRSKYAYYGGGIKGRGFNPLDLLGTIGKVALGFL